jgi:hypothetical protein
MPDYPTTFMKIIKESANGMSAANNERLQVLIPCVIWGGNIDRFKVFRNNVDVHYGQNGAEYLFDMGFETAYLERYRLLC